MAPNARKAAASKPSSRGSRNVPAKAKTTTLREEALTTDAKEDHVSNRAVPLENQQRLLSVFTAAFADLLSLESLTSTLQPLLQKVKQHLFNRAFEQAFGRPEYLEAYVARWSPSRALGYLEIFKEVVGYVDLEKSLKSTVALSEESKKCSRRLNTVCLGGGAGAEVCAFAALHGLLLDQSNVLDEGLFIKVTAVDIAKWDGVLASLRQALTTPPLLSRYASAAVKSNNVELVPSSSFSLDFFQFDLLIATTSEQSPKSFLEPIENADVITLMFTLNELYTVSMPATQKFLFAMTAAARTGTLLLVVDSPGSYSTITLNGHDKKYPMQWLMDHTLLKILQKVPHSSSDAEDVKSVDATDTSPQWEKLITDQSRWFRLPEGLRYPLDLENMRYQMHLYRRL